MKNKILTFSLLLISSLAFAQGTAKVFIARKGLFTTSGAINTFMDGKIVCELNNKSYTVLEVKPGEHKFHAQWYGKNSKDAGEQNEIAVTMEPAKEYYFS